MQLAGHLYCLWAGPPHSESPWCQDTETWTAGHTAGPIQPAATLQVIMCLPLISEALNLHSDADALVLLRVSKATIRGHSQEHQCICIAVQVPRLTNQNCLTVGAGYRAMEPTKDCFLITVLLLQSDCYTGIQVCVGVQCVYLEAGRAVPGATV